ncbi:MAG: hypothetical protein HZA90_05635 [Verrucomicrobia bacterium]|nr:hypothetical protein [Verrucomicrobiota bacterium]
MLIVVHGSHLLFAATHMFLIPNRADFRRRSSRSAQSEAFLPESRRGYLPPIFSGSGISDLGFAISGLERGTVGFGFVANFPLQNGAANSILRPDTEMTDRLFTLPESSYFLFDPRRTGKSVFAQTCYPAALRLDLLEPDVHREYAARPPLRRGAGPQRHGTRRHPIVTEAGNAAPKSTVPATN